MVNTRAKGQSAERQVEAYFKRKGWITYKVPGSRLFNKKVDLFSLFDIFAIGRVSRIFPGRVYVQVKHQAPSMKPFKKFFLDYCHPKYDSVQIWIKEPRQGFRIYESPFFNKKHSRFITFKEIKDGI